MCDDDDAIRFIITNICLYNPSLVREGNRYTIITIL